MPALLRAEKLQKRAARVGFDWPDPDGARAKIDEEFAVVNWARHLDVDPEAALRHANAKFERRFVAMESIAGAGFAGLSLDAKEALWQRVKRQSG